jgi:acyl-CoA reductase-like NAD-dependent aldehyde dehydrogenase
MTEIEVLDPATARPIAAVEDIAPVLAAGCSIILKPAEQTPLTSLRLPELLAAAGLPDGVLQVVTGGARTGAALVEHPGVDRISFTGSSATGRLLLRSAADTIKRVSVELGGKSPNIVFPDAELPAAITGTATAVFANQGRSARRGRGSMSTPTCTTRCSPASAPSPPT